MQPQGEERFRILVGTEGDSYPLMDMDTPEPDRRDQTLADYVLVADYRTQRDPRQVHRQRQFLKELQAKGFQYKVKEDREKVFFGIRADSSIFSLYRTLLMEPGAPAARVDSARPITVPDTTRIRIVNFILNCRTAAGDTFEDLVKDGVFETRFPLHKVRGCLGARPEGGAGGGARTQSPEPGKENLERTWARWRNMFRKQPIDDIRNYFGEKVALYFAWLGWYTCMLVPAALFGLIVFLSGFSLFNASQIRAACDPLLRAATVFLEFWKRQRAHVVLHWDLYGWDEDQEEVALELMNCPDYELQLHQHSYLKSTIILILSLLMICLMIGMGVGRRGGTGEGAVCPPEKSRTFSERESKFTVKFFTLQFFAHFSSLVYIAFILGRINGHPGKTVRLAGLWKLEERPEPVLRGPPPTTWFLSPRWLSHKWRSMRGSEARDPELRDWQRNYRLNPVYTFSLFDEFMEMTPSCLCPDGGSGERRRAVSLGPGLFSGSGPWLPWVQCPEVGRGPPISRLFAWGMDGGHGWRWGRQQQWSWLEEPDSLSPLLGAGTWLQVLETIGVLAVIANGMVIAFTSEFIPRVVYKYRYGPCRQGAHSSADCLTGYINHSLSVFHTKDFEDPVRIKGSENITECRYRDYRNAQDYNFSGQFWTLLAIRLAFLILFEHVALCIKLVAAWFVPDVPQSVKNRVLQQKYEVLLGKLRGGPRPLWGPGLGLRATPASSSSLRSTDV
ncbi:PREDICTED: anoctamin-9 [Myotis davidii]|uniref:anoctamin-9 n=1 Tax=Myotis davidii TaxID=225400 RepID=UPI000767125D|nr:PREDICTED: anoctamin-9 [Myotis davidii]